MAGKGRKRVAGESAGPAPHLPKEVRQEAFLAAYRKLGNITKAAEAVGLHRQIHYQWLREDEGYVEAFENAKPEAVETFEAEAHRRATEGVKKYKFFQGKPLRHPDLCLCGHDFRHHSLGACVAEKCPCDGYVGAPYYEHEYSDTLLLAMLNAHSEKYGKYKHEHSGKDGGALKIEIIKPSDA